MPAGGLGRMGWWVNQRARKKAGGDKEKKEPISFVSVFTIFTIHFFVCTHVIRVQWCLRIYLLMCSVHFCVVPFPFPSDSFLPKFHGFYPHQFTVPAKGTLLFCEIFFCEVRTPPSAFHLAINPQMFTHHTYLMGPSNAVASLRTENWDERTEQVKQVSAKRPIWWAHCYVYKSGIQHTNVY